MSILLRLIGGGGPPAQTISAAGGIGTAEIFGTPMLIPEQFLVLTSIGSLEAFGVPKISQQIRGIGIATGELFGIAKLNMMLALFGIGSLEAFGNAILTPAAGGGISREGRIAIHIAIRIGILLLCFM